ncbi:MAG: hypothetical protein ACREMP_09780 [Candidatus Tyrphobacter sp.]
MNAALVLAVFALFAALMYLRKLPAIVALPLMAIFMSLAAGTNAAELGPIVVNGASALAPVYVAVIFGALLGRVTLDTGIARALVNLAAEYGGENPLLLCLVLAAIVALLFTSLSGLGAIIMVGSIVLPIMMTTGVPRTVAAPLFLMAFALGYIFNIVNWKFYTSFFHVSEQAFVPYAIVLAIVDALALLAFAIVAFARERNYAAWTQAAPSDAQPKSERLHVPWWSLATPILPIILYYVLHMDATPAFLLSAIYGVLSTRPRSAVPTLVASAIRGVESVAPAVILFMGIGMLLVATREPAMQAALGPLVSGGWERNPIAYVVVFGLLSPLVLYRGPLNPFGVGIAFFAVLLSSHALPAAVLVAAVMAVVQVQNVCDPTNTQNVWVANFTGVSTSAITKRTLPFQVAVATLATIAVVVATQPLLRARTFAAIDPPALAQTALPGMEAPASASQRIAVGDDGTPLGHAAADEVAALLNRDGLHAFRMTGDPDAADCSRKPYAAYAAVTTSEFVLIEGIDVDVGITLEDCGGWIVDAWHDHEVVAQPSAGDARTLAAQGVARLRYWDAATPVVSSNLYRIGVAMSPADRPNYFFALFKTPDGNMRAYVRAGGPAYAAGLRTGDVVEKLDGLAWWRYGTYQTQQRAYDGKPHSFEIERDGRTIDVDLASVAPFSPGS